jgi:hypothetical protein
MIRNEVNLNYYAINLTCQWIHIQRYSIVLDRIMENHFVFLVTQLSMRYYDKLERDDQKWNMIK